MKVLTSRIKVLDGQNRDNSDKTIIQSVEKEGVLVPLLVYPDPESGEDFILVAGHRRLASAVHFNLSEVPVEIIAKEQAETARALENLDRKSLHPLDEAAEIRTLQGNGYSNNVICAMLGISQGKLIRRSKLNNLIPEVRNDFLEGKIDAAAAEEYSVMDPNDQKAVWGSLKGTSFSEDADYVREEYLSGRGYSLENCPDVFMKMEPACASCPKNLASDNILFEGSDGSCSDGKCYCKKLSALMEKEGVTSVYASEYSRDKKRIDLLNKNKIRTAKDKDSWSYNETQTEIYAEKKMDIYGNIAWARVEEKDPEEKSDISERKKELEKLYRNDLKELYVNLQKMAFEHVDAYMAKNHKDERFPDNDERVILAKQVLKDNDRALRCFVTGEYYPNHNPMEGADNRKIFALAVFLCATGCQSYQCVSPESVKNTGAFRLPASMQIEDLYQLKTSRAKKRVLELQKEMESYLKEYEGLK